MDAIVSIRAPRPKRLLIARTKLTEQRIADLPKPSRGASYTYDSLAPSLSIRVTAAGVRSFVVVKKINGVTQRITLGRFPGLSGWMTPGKAPGASRASWHKATIP